MDHDPPHGCREVLEPVILLPELPDVLVPELPVPLEEAPEEPEVQEDPEVPVELVSTPLMEAGTSWTLPTILGSRIICDREHSISLPSVRLRETRTVTLLRPWGTPD